MQQIIVQRLRSFGSVCHKIVSPIRIFLHAVAGATEIIERVGHVAVHVRQAFEIFCVGLAIFDDQLFFVFRSRRVLVVTVFGFFVRQRLVPFLYLEHRVFIHLLFDAFLQSQNRQLQNLHRLDHPWRQFLGLYLACFEPEGKTHNSGKSQ